MTEEMRAYVEIDWLQLRHRGATHIVEARMRTIDKLPSPPDGSKWEYVDIVEHTQSTDPRGLTTSVLATFRLVSPQLRHPRFIGAIPHSRRVLFIHAKPTGSVLL